MIKKLLFILLIIILTPLKGSTQTYEGMGFKAGLNYSSNGDYRELNTFRAINSNKEIGYHIGFFGKIGNDIYFRPEFVYTYTRSNYENISLSIQKVDIPLLAGYQILNNLSFFAGPSIQYILDSEFDGKISSAVEKDYSIGLNIGVGINVNKFGIDLRYERGFSENEAKFISDYIGGFDTVDTRPEQIILSITTFLF